jgi:hypothetical protein
MLHFSKNIRLFIRGLFFLATVLALGNLSAQIPNNTWRDHLAYSSASMVAITPEKVFCSMSSGGMLSYEKSSGEVEKLSKVTGLSDVNISSIAYSDVSNILVIGYTNGNIDLITSLGIVNMPDIKRKSITGLKSINQILIHETMAYLACNFGVVQIDLVEQEFVGTYYFGTSGTAIKVNDISILENTIYAATEAGIYKVDINATNLVDYSFWTLMDNLPASTQEYKLIEVFNNQLFAVYTNSSTNKDQIISFTEGADWENWNPVSDDFINQLSSYNDLLSVVTDDKTSFYNSSLQLTKSISMINGRQALKDTDGIIYAAADFRGFLMYKENETEVNLTVTCPRFNTTGFIATKDDYVWVGSGGDYNPYVAAAAHNFYDEAWITLSPGYVDGLDGIGNFYKFAYHPTIDNYVYASSYMFGLFELHDTEVVTKHDRISSSVLATLPENVGVRIADLAFDYKGDLWTIMDETIQPVYVLRGGTEWEQVILSSSIFKANGKWRGLLVTETNQIWILNDRDGIVVLQEQSDGSFYEKYFTIKNQDGTILSMAYSMAEDKNGDIWVGTNRGPIVYSSDVDIFDEDEVYGNMVKLARNDGTDDADFLLDYEIVNDIAVDGGNRKWLATETSGVFLVSEDGLTTLHQFTEDNSPLISNNVISVGVQEKTGEVFISTNEGLVSYMGQATEGFDDFTDVYVYPNPVRPDYDGDITVTGLIEDANVKITDISGNLVYETTSLGGQAIWDGKNFNGHKVQSGVYLVFMTNDDGSKTHITKLVFIH